MKQPTETVYCVLIKGDQSESIPAYITKIGSMPLVAMNECTLPSLLISAQQIANSQGITLTLNEFTQRKIIKTIEPETT